MIKKKTTYSEAILEGFEFLLKNFPEVFILGQGLWSPWYVGNSMKDLDIKYGKNRVIDTPVSESATTGMAVGAGISGMRPIIVHPRMDFMLYAMDSIVNQAAKWSYIFGGQASSKITIRAIINRGGEQGAQHSQALHSWFAHIPGLRVVMPSSVSDARDLLISSVLCNDPVVYIDDRWLYEQEEELGEIKLIDITKEGPSIVKKGNDITLVGCGYTTLLLKNIIPELEKHSISPQIIDLRILNPLDVSKIIESVRSTKNLLVVDGGWKNCGITSEVIASVMESQSLNDVKINLKRLALSDCPAPTSTILEKEYYPNSKKILESILELIC